MNSAKDHLLSVNRPLGFTHTEHLLEIMSWSSGHKQPTNEQLTIHESYGAIFVAKCFFLPLDTVSTLISSVSSSSAPLPAAIECKQ